MFNTTSITIYKTATILLSFLIIFLQQLNMFKKLSKIDNMKYHPSFLLNCFPLTHLLLSLSLETRCDYPNTQLPRPKGPGKVLQGRGAGGGALREEC